MRTAWPLLFVHKPWVVTHQGWLPREGRGGWLGRLKHLLVARAIGISISSAIANDLRAPSTVIGNPYDDFVFRKRPEVPKHRDLVFCGRLTSDKGANILLNALGILRQRSIRPSLSIIGGGPEEQQLRSMTHALSLEDQVTFEGVKTGYVLAQCLNAHNIMVVPSIWREPFGIVALEGIACGCVVVGSESGGLKEAIGPCGVTFPNGDADALAARPEALLSSPQLMVHYRADAATHLSAYTKAAVAEKYLRIFAATTTQACPL